MPEPKSVVPYAASNQSKKDQVATMFDAISPAYDRLNRILSLGIDIGWRNRLIRELKKQNPATVIDMATGTADLAIATAEALPAHVTGVDISEGMLSVGRSKVLAKHLAQNVYLVYGDSENLSYTTSTFDAATVAFGVRNFENLAPGLAELFRVLKPGGMIYILEFGTPTAPGVKQLYQFYFKHVLPLIGKLISRDAAAYTYLPESVEAFPFGQAFVRKLEQAGFSNISSRPLTLGICYFYTGTRAL
jgi:demethylmenaquinone methyltransferase / 2-methoxy-6-polyprenyl-1,4-benzoquinol methylase